MPIRDAWFTVLLSRSLRTLLDRYAIARERAALREMSDTRLSDIGLSRHDALGEAMRPFWQGKRCP